MEAELGSNLRGRTSKMNLTMRLLLFFPGAGDEVDWQLALSDNTISGTMEKTSDPNIYEMADDSGSECGIAHIAYSYASFGDVEGVAFLHLASGDDYVLEKESDTPATFDTRQ